jgi:hypothetical protein
MCIEPPKALNLSMASTCWFKAFVNGQLVGQGVTPLTVEHIHTQVHPSTPKTY